MIYKSTLMDDGAVQRALTRISHEIIERNADEQEICIIGIMRRGIPLAKIIAEKLQSLGQSVKVAELDVSLYRDDVTEQEPSIISKPLIPFDIHGKVVVMVDDVLYTGRTARAAMDALVSHGRPAKIQLAVLIDRGHRELPIRGDYVGKNVPTAKSELVSVKIPPYDDRMCVELYGN